MTYKTVIFTKEELDAEKYPEINQGLELKNEGGEWIIARKKEQFTAFPRGFILAGIIGELSGSAKGILIVIAAFTNRFRNTTITNPIIAKYANVEDKTIKKSLRELKFYHLISRHYLPGGSSKRRRRCITLNRWDTARDLLIKEKNLVIDLDRKVVFLRPNPYRK